MAGLDRPRDVPRFAFATETMAAPREISRYCIPWTPFSRPLEEAVVMLVSTAAVHLATDPPFDVDGDLSLREIPSDATAAELRVADAHYDHACVDSDVNCVFPLDRLRELGRERRIGALAEKHLSMGFTAELRRVKEEVAPAIVDRVLAIRPDCVVLTGG